MEFFSSKMANRKSVALLKNDSTVTAFSRVFAVVKNSLCWQCNLKRVSPKGNLVEFKFNVSFPLCFFVSIHVFYEHLQIPQRFPEKCPFKKYNFYSIHSNATGLFLYHLKTSQSLFFLDFQVL